MWTAVAFATSSRIQTDRNELKDEHIYIERERRRRDTSSAYATETGGEGEKRWESGQIVPFDLPRGRFPRLLLVRRYENLPAHDKREGGGEDRAHPVRLLAPLPEKERSWKGERDGWPRNTSLKGR